MSNFDFIRDEWPSVFEDAHHAESALRNDPRTACFYARRTIEGLVSDIYYLRNLPAPYSRELATRIDAPAFKQLTGPAINQKLTMIRRWGNAAVHETRAVRPETALNALRELFHVIVWAALHHSTIPDQVPQQASFDPRVATATSPLTHAEVIELNRRFEEQDAAHRRELEASEQRIAAMQAEMARLRSEIAEAQARTRVDDTHDYSEAQTRDLFLDTLLHEAGWALDQPRDREYEVTGMPNQQGVGYIDYVLWGADGLPLAVVEAKRTLRSALDGQQQAKLYADCLEARFGRRPVIFYTNGQDHWLWDDAAGYPPRPVQGFYTARELERLIARRTTRQSLVGRPVNREIAGRYYQVRAIQAVDTAFDEQRQRQALLVMATGSGKTRTTIALVEQLMRAGWVHSVLFLADRTELVKQAANAFTEHLPDTAAVNLITNPQGTGRVYCCTHQTMLRMVNRVDDSGRRFTPGAFDLVVIDEAHRSVFGRYGFIFQFFDALLVGLTATPRDEIDRSTYRLFHLEDGVPTDAYELGQAVEDGYLVPPVAISLGTRILRSGITYDELTAEEQEQWDALDWGEDGPPDAVGADEINHFLFNADTIDKALGHLMQEGYRTDNGERIGKTIIFAKNQRHAEVILERFDLGWPEHAGRLARIITHSASYTSTLIDDFKSPEGECRIAISVDMLDTGIDVPEVVNLVFFKPVYSKTKFWQMIGRGTRLCPDLFGPGRDKTDFYLFDFCGNLEYFSADPPSQEGSSQKSLSQRLFETRVQIARALQTDTLQRDAGLANLREEIAGELHGYVAGMTLDNVLVRPHRRAVERWSRAQQWEQIEATDLEELERIAGLPSAAGDSNVDALRFDMLMLTRQHAQLTGDAITADRVQRTVQQIASTLLTQTAIPLVAERAELLEQVVADDWWVDVTLPLLETARKRLRHLLQFVPRGTRAVVYADFEDALTDVTEVELPQVTAGLNAQRFAEKARAYLRAHENELALQRLLRNKPLTPDDLASLERLLQQAGGEDADIARASAQAGGLGLFVRSLVGLDRAAASEAFAQFLDEGRYSVEQIRFVNLIIDELTRNGTMPPGRLYEPPYTDQGDPDLFFAEPDIDVIVDILHRIRAHALAEGA